MTVLLFSRQVMSNCFADCFAVHKAPLSLILPRQEYRQEYWSGLPFPSPWDRPDPGIEPTFPAYISCIPSRFFTAEDQGSPKHRRATPQLRASPIALE